MSKVKRFASIFLAVSIVVASALAVPSSAEDSAVAMTITAFGDYDKDGLSDTKTLEVFSSGGKLLMSIQDIAAYTRCTLGGGANLYALEHAGGRVTISIDVNSGQVTEYDSSVGEGQKFATQNIVCKNIGGVAYGEAYPLLCYFGATVMIDEGRLHINMPKRTLWEVEADYMSVLGENPFGLYKGSEGGWFIGDKIIKFDIFNSFTSREAIYGALQNDLNKYPEVKADNNAYEQRFFEDINRAQDLLGAAGAGKSIYEIYRSLKITPTWFAILKNAGSLFSLDDNGFWAALDSVGDVKDVVDGAVDSFGKVSIFDAALLVMDAFLTGYERAVIPAKGKSAVRNVLNDPHLKDVTSPPCDWYFDDGEYVAAALADDATTYITAAAEKTAEFLVDSWAMFLTRIADKIPVGLAVSLTMALVEAFNKLLPGVAKWTPFGQYNVSEHRIMLTYSHVYASMALDCWIDAEARAAKEKYRNMDTIQDYYDSLLLFLSFQLLNNEEKQNLYDSENLYGFTNDKIDKLKKDCEKLAVVLNDLYHSDVTIRPDMDSLAKEVTKFNQEALAAAVEEAVIPYGTYELREEGFVGGLELNKGGTFKFGIGAENSGYDTYTGTIVNSRKLHADTVEFSEKEAIDRTIIIDNRGDFLILRFDGGTHEYYFYPITDPAVTPPSVPAATLKITSMSQTSFVYGQPLDFTFTIEYANLDSTGFGYCFVNTATRSGTLGVGSMYLTSVTGIKTERVTFNAEISARMDPKSDCFEVTAGGISARYPISVSQPSANSYTGNFVIEGKWKQYGNVTYGQAQNGAIIVFNGMQCNFYSPQDTYAFYKEGGSYKLDITSFLFAENESYPVVIIDNDNITIKGVSLRRVG